MLEKVYDAGEIRQGIEVLIEPGMLMEMRTFKGNEVGSGVFNDVEAMVHEAIRLSETVDGVYVTLNPVNPALAEPTNCVAKRAETAISDAQILRRARLLLDFDPVRPTKVAATEAEHAQALDRAQDCRQWLTGFGWPEPAIVDSGNGAHLIYAIDLPNDQDSLHLVKQVLAAVAFYWTDDRSMLI